MLRFIVTYIGALRIDQIAPFLSIFHGRICTQDSTRTSENQHHNTANYTLV